MDAYAVLQYHELLEESGLHLIVKGLSDESDVSTEPLLKATLPDAIL